MATSDVAKRTTQAVGVIQHGLTVLFEVPANCLHALRGPPGSPGGLRVYRMAGGHHLDLFGHDPTMLGHDASLGPIVASSERRLSKS